jgi:preprotein translocase subunit SecG
MLNSLLLADDWIPPQWVSDSFPIIQGILVGIIALAAVIMILAILVSPPETGIGNNPITGINESYYAKNKRGNNMGRVRNLIIICASLIAVCAVAYFILYGIAHVD